MDDRCKGKKVLVIGAGGAARGIALCASNMGTDRLHLQIERLEKAEQLCSGYRRMQRAVASWRLKQSLADFGLIVQTTSVGMNFAQQGMPLNPE